MPLLALLKMIPSKAYLYAAVVAAILMLIVYERHQGAVHEETKVTKVAVVAEKKVDAAQAIAQSTETQNVLIYKQAVAVPPVADLGLVCERPGSGSLPATDSVQGAGAGDKSADRGTGQSYDPSGAVLTRSHDADAQIIYLQKRIHELEAEMNAAP